MEKLKEREAKLMKLLSAIMEKGVDIEKIYVEQVMNSKKTGQSAQNILNYQIEDIPEIDEAFEIGSSINKSINDNHNNSYSLY